MAELQWKCFLNSTLYPIFALPQAIQCLRPFEEAGYLYRKLINIIKSYNFYFFQPNIVTPIQQRTGVSRDSCVGMTCCVPGTQLLLLPPTQVSLKTKLLNPLCLVLCSQGSKLSLYSRCGGAANTGFIADQTVESCPFQWRLHVVTSFMLFWCIELWAAATVLLSEHKQRSSNPSGLYQPGKKDNIYNSTIDRQ